jgi:hypothetical protein
MKEEIGPYVRHSFDETRQCVHVYIKYLPPDWEHILRPKGPGMRLVAVLAAPVAWVIGGISRITTFAG